MKRRNLRFQTRLILVNFSLVFFVVLLVSAWWFRAEEGRILQEIRGSLSKSVSLVQHIMEDSIEEKGWSGRELSALAQKLGENADVRVTIVDKKGKVWGDTNEDPAKMENHADRSEIRSALMGETGQSVRYSRTLGSPMWYQAVPLTIRGQVMGVVRVAKMEREIQEALNRIRRTFYFSLILITLLTFGVGLIVTHYVTRPLMELERLVQRFSAGDLSGRAANLGTDEFAYLGSTLNEMAQRLSASIDEMKEEKQKLQVILENMADGLLVFDHRMHLEVMNRTAERLLGLHRTKAIGRTIPELLINHNLEEWMNSAQQQKMPVGGEFQTHFPVNRTIQALAAPIEEDTGENSPTGTIILLRDLTRLRRLEQIRQDFVANVSHELRTPVTAVRVMAETLVVTADPANETYRFIQGILQESERMSRIVNDLLTLTQLDDGRSFDDPFAPFYLGQLVQEVLEGIAGKTNHKINMEILEDLPQVAAQSDRIRQVLLNLLENAQKYTPEDGVITVRAGVKDDRIIVTVTDTGPGIPRSDQERIFERLYRVDKARSRAMGGTGLGLSIVKRIVEGYGGQVWVESQEGQGAAFHFTLPVYQLAG